LQGGALREVGTHFFFGLHEIFGHGCVVRVKATVDFPESGDGAETGCTGLLEMQSGLIVQVLYCVTYCVTYCATYCAMYCAVYYAMHSHTVHAIYSASWTCAQTLMLLPGRMSTNYSSTAPKARAHCMISPRSRTALMGRCWSRMEGTAGQSVSKSWYRTWQQAEGRIGPGQRPCHCGRRGTHSDFSILSWHRTASGLRCSMGTVTVEGQPGYDGRAVCALKGGRNPRTGDCAMGNVIKGLAMRL
jgi:hypothetical protein